MFLGAVRSKEERRRRPVYQSLAVVAAVQALATVHGLPDDVTLDPRDGPEAYLFQCRQCEGFLAYAEMHWVAGPFVTPPYSSPRSG
jgi:hypothetical protein